MSDRYEHARRVSRAEERAFYISHDLDQFYRPFTSVHNTRSRDSYFTESGEETSDGYVTESGEETSDAYSTELDEGSDLTDLDEDTYYTSSEEDEYSFSSNDDNYSSRATYGAPSQHASFRYQVHKSKPSEDRRKVDLKDLKVNKKNASSRQSDLEPFKHTRLGHPEAQLRLVTVHSWKGYPIECSMTAMRRSKANKRFRALSYHWGPSLPAHTIRVNGRTFTVGKNLHEFLEHAAKMKAKGVAGWTTAKYWIDALCIDQSKSPQNTEKATQLKYIRHVYRRALETIIWLGPGGKGIAEAMRYIRRQSHAVTETVADDADDAVSVLLASSRDDLLRDRNLVKAISVLLDSSYWSRVWILQEIAVSDEKRTARECIRIICGDGELAWSQFMQYTIRIPLLQFQSHERQMNEVRRQVCLKQPVWLISYLYKCRDHTVPGLEIISKANMTLGLLIHLSERSESSEGPDASYIRQRSSTRIRPMGRQVRSSRA